MYKYKGGGGVRVYAIGAEWHTRGQSGVRTGNGIYLGGGERTGWMFTSVYDYGIQNVVVYRSSDDVVAYYGSAAGGYSVRCVRDRPV